MTELFLICALALPQANFPAMWTTNESMREKEVRLLNEFIQRVKPGSDIRITDDGVKEGLPGLGWIKIPIRWDNHQIWIRRIKASA